MELIFTDGNDKRFIDLCCELDDYLNEIVGGEKQREKYNQYNTLGDIYDVILAICDGQCVGCARVKKYDSVTAEVKRVFIKKEYRRSGYAKVLMQALEHWASYAGYSKLILETGHLLKPAVALYQKLGYDITENYGGYVNMPESVCMAKLLHSANSLKNG